MSVLNTESTRLLDDRCPVCRIGLIDGGALAVVGWCDKGHGSWYYTERTEDFGTTYGGRPPKTRRDRVHWPDCRCDLCVYGRSMDRSSEEY